MGSPEEKQIIFLLNIYYKHMRKNNLVRMAFMAMIGAATLFFLADDPARAAEKEQIDSFEATIRINADASVDISERIAYDFGPEQKHGIYRRIPVRYEARGGNYNLRLSDVSVTDENGRSYRFEVSAQDDYKEIKVGQADVLMAGKKIFVISYKLKRAINYFEDHDQLYLNVTGDRSTVPILSASARILLPGNSSKEDLDIVCYSGISGSKTPCSAASHIVIDQDGTVGGAEFSEQDLAPGEGLTVAVGFLKGIVHQPTAVENLRETLIDNIVLFVPLFMLIAAFWLWRTRGRDPLGRGTIIAEFEAPDGVTPAEAGTLVDEQCGQKELTAELIELAIRGFLTIRREEKEVLAIKSAEYTFRRLKEDDGTLSAHEKILLDGIFDGRDTVRLSKLKNSFWDKYDRFTKEVYGSIARKGYFFKNPQEVRARYFVSYLFLLIIVFAAIFSFMDAAPGAFAVLSFAASLIIIGIFSYAMPQKTASGVRVREHILGLKRYLAVAEKDRLEFHNAPEKNPGQFEKLLPLAIVLGVEKEWAKQFEGIYRENPAWYEDSRGFGHFSAIYLADSLGDFRSDFGAAAATPPAASGSSGFGGGGFSGGGFGGGGTGSW